MPEISTEVKTFELNYICDSCLKGFMKPTGIALSSNPPQYIHKCTDCDHVESYRIKYPFTSYKHL